MFDLIGQLVCAGVIIFVFAFVCLAICVAINIFMPPEKR
jgi:hypothetical protein